MVLTEQDLAEMKLFHGVETDSIIGLLQGCPITALGPQEELIKPGEDSECMYVVLEGEISVHLEDLDSGTVLTLSRGDSVGEIALIDNQPRSAFVVANEDSRVLAISREIFWGLANRIPGIAVNLLILFSARLRGNNDTLVESLKEQKKYRSIAAVDGLTGLHNRRWLDKHLARHIERARVGGELLCVAMIDVDEFKTFNGTYGHQAGDFVLTSVAHCIGSGIRPTDLSARYGGDEFTIIFPHTSAEDAVSAVNRVREVVNALDLVTPLGMNLPGITISVGVAQLQAEQDLEGLVEAADRALYQAKEMGRNRVCKAPL